MEGNYLSSAKKQFESYKLLGERTFNQLDEKNFFWQYNKESNSIAVIVNHLSGNMKSRWTDFLSSDGEKSWRNRDSEFEDVIKTKKDLMQKWNEGWNCLFDALNSLIEEDLAKTVYIRKEGHTVVDAINRQLTHYASHVGQIIYIGRMIKADQWESLSIQKGKSDEFNKEKFAAAK